MKTKLFDRIVNSLDANHKSIIKSMKNYANEEKWTWAVPTIDDMPVEQFAYIHQIDRDVAKHYLEIIKLTKSKYEKYKILQ